MAFDLFGYYALSASLDKLSSKIDQLLAQFSSFQGVIMADLTALTTQVKANTDTEASAVLLLGKLSDLIKQNASDPVAIAALADQLAASKDALAAAIVANTPAVQTKKKP
jgi:hypothetical protein